MKTPRFDVLLSTVESALMIIDEQKMSHNVVGRLVSLQEKGNAVIIGDLHGDINSLNKIIKDSNLAKNLRNEDQYLICLGDYIDRGPAQIQVLYRLLSLLEKYPEQVILLRGNHEGPTNILFRVRESPYNFQHIVAKTYPNENHQVLVDKFKALFESLYTACVIENQALLVHGGIPIEATALDEIAYAHEHYPDSKYLEEILWNDPSTLRGSQLSFRGAGYMFGVDLASLFLMENGLKMLIRGHESHDSGYYFHDDKILTLFSCKLPLYRNQHLSYLSIPLDIDFTWENLQENLHQL